MVALTHLNTTSPQPVACSDELPLTPFISFLEPLHCLINQSASLTELSMAQHYLTSHSPPRGRRNHSGMSVKMIKYLPASEEEEMEKKRDMCCKEPWKTVTLWPFLIVIFYMWMHLIYSLLSSAF